MPQGSGHQGRRQGTCIMQAVRHRLTNCFRTVRCPLCLPLTQVWRRVWGLPPSLWLRRLQQRLHSGCQLPGCECHRSLLCTVCIAHTTSLSFSLCARYQFTCRLCAVAVLLACTIITACVWLVLRCPHFSQRPRPLCASQSLIACLTQALSLKPMQSWFQQCSTPGILPLAPCV